MKANNSTDSITIARMLRSPEDLGSAKVIRVLGGRPRRQVGEALASSEISCPHHKAEKLRWRNSEGGGTYAGFDRRGF